MTLAKKWFNEGIQEGMDLGRRNRLRKAVENMLKEHMPFKHIAKLLGINTQEVKNIQAQLHSQD